MIDWAALDRQYGRSPGMVEVLVRTALESYGNHPLRLRAAADRTDFDDIAFVAHSIKGTAGYFSAAALREQALATERGARAGQPQSGALARGLAFAFEGFLEELRQGPPAAGEAPQ